ncbi:hypothetical protein COTS27_00319 [Spirochaetota bacterium]|nr:hypothetical protein COTS27_00319 [Spirochaetota bacterium]
MKFKTPMEKASHPKANKLSTYRMLPVRYFSMKNWSFTLILLFAIGISNPLHAKTNLSFATLSPKSTIWGGLIRNIVREVYTKSEKEVLIRVYYGGVQGDESEMKDKITLGQLDGGFFTGNGLGALAEEIRILEIPGLIKDYEAASKIYTAMLDDFNRYFNKKGYELLGISELGFAYFYSKKPIPSLADIRKTRMWLWKGDAFAGSIMKTLNIPIVAVSFTEVLPSLQTGLIDGVYATPTGLLSLEWQNEVNYMLDLPLTLVSSGIVLSKKKWDTLSPNHQEIIRNAVRTHLERYKPILHKKEEESLAAIKKINIKLLSSRENLTDLRKKSDKIINKFPPTLKTRIQNLLYK